MAVSKTANAWGNFQPVKDAPKYRLIWRSAGLEKVGKDHFALTAPGPVAIQSFDVGLEGVVEKFLRKPLGPKDIRSTEYEFQRNLGQDAAIDLRDRFIEDFETALKVARTIIWDTETEAWELFRYAEFGKASAKPSDYVELNSRYRDLIQMAYEADVNFGLLQKMKKKWITIETTDANGKKKEKPKSTDLFEPVGFNDTGYVVQVNLFHSWDKDRGFVVEIGNCRQNMAIAGAEFEQGELTFPMLGTLVFPETDEEMWR